MHRIVKISAREVDLDATPHFAEIATIDAHLEAAAVASTILRPDHFMTNLLQQAPLLREGQVVYPGGAGALAWIDPRDIAAVAVAALTAAEPITGTLTLTGPQTLGFDALAAELSGALGRDIAWIDPPNAAWRQGLAGAGLPGHDAELLGDMFASVAARPQPPVTGDVERVIGRPPTALADWAAEVLAPALAVGAAA